MAKKVARNQVIIVDGQPKVVQQLSRMEAMEKAELYIVKNLPKYLRKLHAKAMGLMAVKDTKEGPVVYSVPPDLVALQYLIDRGLGRTPQRHEVTGQSGGPMEILPWAPASMALPAPVITEVIDATGVQEVPSNESNDQPQAVEA